MHRLPQIAHLLSENCFKVDLVELTVSVATSAVVSYAVEVVTGVCTQSSCDMTLSAWRRMPTHC